MITVYAYTNCGTCQKALKYLAANKVAFKEVPIREQPPSLAELRTVLAASGGDIRRLFNVSGQDYRALGMKDRLPTMTQEEALKLLASNGNLVKRPFVVMGKRGLVGFKIDEWDQALG